MHLLSTSPKLHLGRPPQLQSILYLEQLQPTPPRRPISDDAASSRGA